MIKNEFFFFFKMLFLAAITLITLSTPAPTPTIKLIYTGPTRGQFNPRNSDQNDCASFVSSSCYGGLGRVRTVIDRLRAEATEALVLSISGGGHYFPTILSRFDQRTELYVSLAGFDLTLLSLYDFTGPREEYFSPMLTRTRTVVSNLIPYDPASSWSIDMAMYPQHGVAVLSMFDAREKSDIWGTGFGRAMSISAAVDGGVARARARGASYVVVIFHMLTLEEVQASLMPLVLEKMDLVISTVTSDPGARTLVVTKWLNDTPGVAFNEQYAGEGVVYVNVTAAKGLLPVAGLVDLRALGATVPQHPLILAELVKVQAPFSLFFQQTAFTTGALLKGGILCRKAECTAGRYLTAALLEWGKRYLSLPGPRARYTIGLQNSGGIRSNLGPDNVSISQLLAACPFQNKVVMVRTTGAAVARAIQHSFSKWTNSSVVASGEGRFLCVAGFRFTFSVPLNVPVSIDVRDSNNSWVPLSLGDTVDVVTVGFLANGGDGHTSFLDAPRVASDLLASDAIREQSLWAAPDVSESFPFITISGERLPHSGFFCPAGSQLEGPSLTCKPCSAGLYRPFGGGEGGMCLPCPRGFYAPFANMSECVACPPHSRTAVGAGSECICVEGYLRVGNDTCERCPDNAYSAFGASECTSCPPNSLVIGDAPGRSAEDCLCVDGYYKFTNGTCRKCPDLRSCASPESGLPRRGYFYSRADAGEIKVCPEGARCDGMNTFPVALPGRWTAAREDGSEDPVFLRCASVVACPGSLKGGECPDGYKNKPMCTQCIKGYYLFSGTCVPCGRQGARASLRLPFGIVILILIICYFARKARSVGVPGRPMTTSIVSEFFQGMFVLGRIRQAYPPTVNYAMQVLSMPFSLNVEHLAIECYAPRAGFRAKWAMVVLVPVGLAAMFLVLGVVMVCVLGKGRKMYVFDRFVDGYLRVFLAFYLIFAVGAASPFSCTLQPDGRWSLDADPVLPCFEGWWWRFLPATVVSALAYIVLFPAFVFLVLFKNRRALIRSPAFRRRFGSLFLPFTAWFWGIVVIAESLLVTAALTAAYTIPAAAIPALIIVKTTSIILTVMFNPFPRFKEHLLSVGLKFNMVCLLLTAASIAPGVTTDRSKSAVIFFLLVLAGTTVSVGAVLYRFYLLYRRRRIKAINPELKQVLAAICSESGYAATLSWLRAELKFEGNTEILQDALLGLFSPVLESYLAGSKVIPDRRADDILIASVAPGTFTPHIVPHLRQHLLRTKSGIFLSLVRGLLSIERRKKPLQWPEGKGTEDSTQLFAYLFGSSFFHPRNTARMVESEHFLGAVRFLFLLTRPEDDADVAVDDEKPALLNIDEVDVEEDVV
jgi:hypothetical protein